MAQDHEPAPTHQTNLSTEPRWPLRRGLSLRRRRKVPIIRLGGDRPRGRGILVVRMLRRMRLRWIKLQYLRMLKKAKEYYRDLMRDVKLAGSTLEAYQQRLLMETSFAVPGMGITFSNFLSVHGSDPVSRSFII